MAQALRVIAVYLHMAVEGLHLLCPVEQVVGVAGLVIRCEVPRIVVGKGCFHSPFRVLGQVVRRVVLIALLHSCRYPAAAVPGPVIVEFLGAAGVFHPCQLVKTVVGVAEACLLLDRLYSLKVTDTKPHKLSTIKNFGFQHLSWVVPYGENHPFEKYHFPLADQP